MQTEFWHKQQDEGWDKDFTFGDVKFEILSRCQNGDFKAMKEIRPSRELVQRAGLSTQS